MAMGLSVEEVDFLFAANVRGVFLTATEWAKRLDKAGSREKQHGRIVLIGSITAEKVFPATSVYCATKAAVRHLVKALAREWARRRTSVTVIQPGYFASDMTAEVFQSAIGAALGNSSPNQELVG